MKKNEKISKAKSSNTAKKFKKAEPMLYDENKLFHILAEQSSDIILLINRESIVTYANAETDRVLGLKKDEIVGSYMYKYLHPDDFQLVADIFDKFFNDTNTGAQTAEIRISNKDGSWHTVDVTGTNLIFNNAVQAVVVNLRDITERKKVDELLHRSEEKYRTVLEDIKEGYFEIDLAGNFTFFNDTVCRVLGYTREELIGMNNRCYTEPEDLKKVFQAYNKVFATGEPFRDLAWWITRKDGTKRYIEGFITLLKDSSGNPIGFRGIAHDITERKQTEAALWREQQFSKSVLDNLPGIFYLYTYPEKRLVLWNKQHETLLGFNAGEIKGRIVTEWFAPENREAVSKAIERIMEKGQNSVEAPLVAKDGRQILYYLPGVRFEADGRLYFMGIGMDITERKRTEERLRDEEQRFRALADQSSDIIILVNNKGIITYENQASDILGINAEERIDTSVFERVHPDDLTLVTDSFNILFSDRDAPIQKAEIRLRHLNGSWHTFEAIGSNLVRNNVIESAIVNLRDITERKRAEILIKKSEEKYHLLADHMKDQVWLMDLNMKLTYVSPSVERLTGYSSDEIKKMNWENILTAESLQKATEFISVELPRALQASSGYLLFRTLELEFILKGGQKVWGECAFSLIRDETGRALSILGEARNITERKQAEEKLQQTLDSLKKAVGTTIQVLVSALEARDPYTSGHQSRSANLACAIATEMGLTQDKIEGINMAGMIHDIGKLSIPAEILSKPTKLTNLEFSMIKVHPQSGYEMLKDVESPWPLAQIVHQHHERMDGTGYPHKLQGDEILIEARILAVADVVEAMASHRPYRASLGIDTAINEIEKNKGILYDDAVVDACLRLFREKGYQLP